MANISAWLEKNKDLWRRVYDEVITPDLEKEWTMRNEEHQKEMKSKVEEHEILLTHVSTGIVATARLKEENARLKRLLLQQGNGAALSAEQLEASTSDATVSAAEYRTITDKFDELNKRYQHDVHKMIYLERKNVAVMQKNKEMKESVKAWQEYCDRNLGKQKMKKESKVANEQTKGLIATEEFDARPKLPSSPGSMGITTQQSLVGQMPSSPAPRLPLTHVTISSPNPNAVKTKFETAGREQADIDAARERTEKTTPSLSDEPTPTNPRSAAGDGDAASLGQPSSVRTTSSQTTEDEIAERNNMINQMDAEDEDDMPQFVSERSLKRKRKLSIGVRVYTDRSDGTPAKPIRVKEELYSSPPAQSTALELQRKETMDLDELAPNVAQTPHRQYRQNLSVHSKFIGTLCKQRSNSVLFNGNLVKLESNEEAEMEIPDLEAVNDSETADARANSEPGESMRMPAEVLQLLDPNVVANVRDSASNKRMKKAKMRQREKLDFLMESDESIPTDDRMRPPPGVARVLYNQRLKQRKGIQSPTIPPTNTRKTAPAKVRTAQVLRPSFTNNRQTPVTSSARAPQRPDPRTVPGPDSRPLWTLVPPSECSRTSTAVAPPLKQQGPLRSKPVWELNVQDFKTNPSYNQGYTHAFSETLRKRSDRLCLPGCTNSSCCGSTFRALAVAAAPMSSSQEEDLLQDYLGDAYDSFGFTQMNQGERQEIVLQARTRKMAKDHGKHRQAFERGRSPPGFWRTGFPSTQEVEADRAKAKEIERELVEERWLEAMRRGGKWIFRDE